MAMVMSATLPGVRAKATGRPRSSAKAWILLVLPPRERPIASAYSPFLSQPPRVRFDMTGIDAKLFKHWSCRSHLLEDPLPNTALRPPVVAIIDRCVRSILRGA